MKLVTATKRPCPEALDQGGGVWLVPAGARLAVGTVPLTGTAARAAVATVIDKASPLDGRKPIKRVFSGMCDHVVNELGELVPVRIVPDKDGKPTVEDATAIDDLEIVDVRVIQ